MDVARECSSWSGKLHFRLILVQGKASFHLIFISDYSFWNKLWMCSTVTSSIRFFFLNANQFKNFLHVKNMAKFTFLNQVTKTNLSQGCFFFKFCFVCFFICRVVHGHNKQLLTTIRLHKCSSCWKQRLQISNLKTFDPTIKCASALHTSSASVENLVQHNFHNQNG